MKFITLSHLQTLVAKIKSSYVSKETGKGLSANDLTTTLKSNYDAAHSHSQAAHAPSGAQVNVIESVKVNGTAQTVTSKAVNITVPTKVSDLTDGSSYPTTTAMNTAIASAVGSAGHLKRTIVTTLPAVGSADADTIYMKAKSAGSGDNMYDEYMVISGKWEKIGDTEVDLTGYIKESDIEAVTDAEINALFV